MSGSVECRLCGASARRVGGQRLLGRHEVAYFQCPACELLQTETPYWLGEAYSKAMTALDTGAVSRNQTCAWLTAVVAGLAGISSREPYLDFGGGHGVFTRMMRDLGFDFRWFDRYAENLYAAGFEGDLAAPHALVTSFEVFEHLGDVGDDLARLFAPRPAHVLVGTELHHGFDPDWWYLMAESGQHVAFFTERTMAWLGHRFGYDVIAGPQYTLFRRRDLALGAVRRTLLGHVVRQPAVTVALVGFVPEIVRRRLARSLVLSDHAALRARAGST